MEKSAAATVTVEWGYELHTLSLTKRNWSRIIAGRPVSVRGRGYRYEGEFFWDYWHFSGGRNGTLTVMYGEDNAVGFDGTLEDAMVDVRIV